ncbi:MAG: acyl carrier protein [Gemmatimonadaceae bacterium]|nr:acyl carrier protein [Gemmatimonadaceae bacterium]
MSQLDTLKTAFATALGLPPTTEFESLEYRKIPEWDSVAHMALVMEIETAFDIMLPTDDVIGLSSFAKAQEIVAKHGATGA